MSHWQPAFLHLVISSLAKQIANRWSETQRQTNSSAQRKSRLNDKRLHVTVVENGEVKLKETAAGTQEEGERKRRREAVLVFEL